MDAFASPFATGAPSKTIGTTLTISLLHHSGGLQSGSESHVCDSTHVTTGNSEVPTLSPSGSPAVLHPEVGAGVTHTDDSVASTSTVPVVIDTSPIPHKVVSNAVSDRQGS